MADPTPDRGEVRVRLTRSGINPGDTAKRRDALGMGMPYPRVIPHSDGAGTIDLVGDGVDTDRVGQRVWVYGAQTGRPSGTAAQYTVVPSELAVAAPDTLGDEIGACLGVPGITARQAVLADGPVEGGTVLVQGVRGAVASMAAQIAERAGATVIGTVRTGPVTEERWPVVALDEDPVAAIRRLAPGGVDRVIEVALSANIELDASVGHNATVIAAYNSAEATPGIPFWPLAIGNMVLRLIGSNTFPPEIKQHAAAELTSLGASGGLETPVGQVFDLDRIAEAQDLVDSGQANGRVLLRIPEVT